MQYTDVRFLIKFYRFSAVPFGSLTAQPVAPSVHAFAGLGAYREDLYIGVSHFRELRDLVHVEIKVRQDVCLVDDQRAACPPRRRSP